MMYQENHLRRSSGSENDTQSNDNEIKLQGKDKQANLEGNMKLLKVY